MLLTVALYPSNIAFKRGPLTLLYRFCWVISEVKTTSYVKFFDPIPIEFVPVEIFNMDLPPWLLSDAANGRTLIPTRTLDTDAGLEAVFGGWDAVPITDDDATEEEKVDEDEEELGLLLLPEMPVIA